MNEYLYDLPDEDIGQLVECIVVQILVDLLDSIPAGRASMAMMQARIDDLLDHGERFAGGQDIDENFSQLVLRSLNMKLRTRTGSVSSGAQIFALDLFAKTDVSADRRKASPPLR